MTSKAKSVLDKALGLDAVERAELIEALFRSFDVAGDRGIDSRWAAEAESRIDAYDAGKLKAAPADAVFRRIAKQ